MATLEKNKHRINKVYGKYFFVYVLIYLLATFIFSLGYENYAFNLSRGFIITSLITILGFGHMIAQYYENSRRERIKEKYTSKDDLYGPAINYMRSGGDWTTSGLQEHFKIGYARADALHKFLTELIF